MGLCPGWLSGWGRRDCLWVSGKAVGRPRPGTGLWVALGTPAPTPPPRGLRRESGWQPARSRSPRACGEQPRPARGRAGGWVPGQRRVPAQGSGGARPLALRRLCSWRRHRGVAQGVRAPRFCSPGFRRRGAPTAHGAPPSPPLCPLQPPQGPGGPSPGGRWRVLGPPAPRRPPPPPSPRRLCVFLASRAAARVSFRRTRVIAARRCAQTFGSLPSTRRAGRHCRLPHRAPARPPGSDSGSTAHSAPGQVSSLRFSFLICQRAFIMPPAS